MFNVAEKFWIASLCTLLSLAGCSKSKSTPAIGESQANSAAGDLIQSEEDAARLSESRNWIKYSLAYTNAASDLLEEFDADERQGVRYFSLIHMYNGGASEGDLEAARQGLSKALNSVSRNSSIVKPKPVDNFKLVYRIKLSSYGWSTKDWDFAMRGYPYLVIPGDETSLGALQNDTETEVPIVNADWFIANAMRPPLYYLLQDAPDTLAGLEEKLGVDMLANIKNKKVMRAAFDNSQVAPENRVIERHEINNGFMWRSYEFDSSDGSADVLDNPLGPATADGGPFGAELAFKNLGTEIIYERENGMLGFYIAGLDLQRIDEAPAEEDKDPIPAGAACMACHARGLIDRDDIDQVRDKADDGAYKSLRSTVRALYPGSEEIVDQLREDTKRYAEALKDAGVDTSKKDPVSRTAEKHNARVTHLQAAVELGVEVSELKEYIAGNSRLSEIWKRETIKRSQFTKIYQDLADDLQ